IRASLQESMAIDTCADAIALALKRGITRDSRVGMGNGLAGTLEIARVNGGSLHLWSGDATFRLVNGAECGFLSHSQIQGTGVCLSLRTNHPVDLGDTFIGSPGFSYINAEAERISEEGGIRVVDECAHIGNRQPASMLRRKVAAILPSLDAPLVLDF